VNQPQLLQKVEGAVDRWRRTAAILLQVFQQRISPYGFVLPPHQFQHPTPNGGEALTLLLTKLFRSA